MYEQYTNLRLSFLLTFFQLRLLTFFQLRFLTYFQLRFLTFLIYFFPLTYCTVTITLTEKSTVRTDLKTLLFAVMSATPATGYRPHLSANDGKKTVKKTYTTTTPIHNIDFRKTRGGREHLRKKSVIFLRLYLLITLFYHFHFFSEFKL